MRRWEQPSRPEDRKMSIGRMSQWTIDVVQLVQTEGNTFDAGQDYETGRPVYASEAGLDCTVGGYFIP